MCPMAEDEDKIIQHIEQKALKKLARLSKEIVVAKSEDKEEIMSGMEFERWLADSCCESLEK